MRKLKYHEKKLLKKVDFLQWKRENSHRELEVGAPRPALEKSGASSCYPLKPPHA